uniref:Uncharacterized protein n=1 Tax=Acrobeloides nanus TaxID=290746 RepID=A0A914BVS8_9BILA
MTRACLTCSQKLGDSREKFLLGVQILAGGNFQALAVAQATEFDFIRAECYVFAHIADEGLMNGCSGDLMRYRKYIGAENIAVITDIKKKHSSHAITSDLTIGDVAHASEFFLADGVIVTGFCTGKAASLEDVA